ncbi:aminoglycoside phosphotransferase family protein [Shewanella salipaludis]|nr:phosphotransferase [Shewanella salipaludis]
MTLSDPRFISLTHWLSQYLDTHVTPVLISGDASFRRYFRVHGEQRSFIAVDSPPAQVPIAAFMQLAEAYADAGLRVPQTIAASEEMGFMLLSDLGDVQLLAVLNQGNVGDYYRQALTLLPRIAGVTATAAGPLPEYDAAFVERELQIFTHWLLGTHLGLPLDGDTERLLDAAFKCLVASALEQPTVGMHRDFHSRNLMLQQEGLSVIDFQDAVLGPVTYDAVSLLRDCYVRWPDALVDELMEYHYRLCMAEGLLDNNTDIGRYRRWFDLMGVQRHLKAAGIFARLNHRDNKPAYMADIPLTLSYIVDVAGRYPELQPLAHWVAARVIPALEARG